MRRVLIAAASVAAVATASGAAVVAAAMALFHLLQDSLGTPGAYAVVALAAAVVAIIGALLGSFTFKREHKPPPEPTLSDTVGRMVRERPFLSAGAAIAAGVIALKNPAIAGTILTSFLAGRSQKDPPRRR